MKAWYFAHESKKLQYGDGRGIKIGETHTVDCVPQCCKEGLHGSVKLRDALSFAKGYIIYRVDINGKIDKQDDKICGQSRTYLYGGVNVENELREFARWCVLEMMIKCGAPEVIVNYFKTGEESIRGSIKEKIRAIHSFSLHTAYGDAVKEIARYFFNDDLESFKCIAVWTSRFFERSYILDKQNKKLTQLINKAIRSRT